MFLKHGAKIQRFCKTTKLFSLNSVKIFILIFLTFHSPHLFHVKHLVTTVPRETLFL